MASFDFDYWRDLAQRDPAAFFKARSAVLEGFIASHPAPQARRLREMQRFIDCIRAASGSPMRAVNCMAVMMEDHLSVLRERGRELDSASATLRRVTARFDPLA